jgi:hypothetical protein
MEKFENFEQPPKKYYESELGKFEVDEPSVLTEGDINAGDRAIITTRSGNRYMVRRSESRGGAIMIYNERTGFSDGYPIVPEGKDIATVGENLNVFLALDEKNKKGTRWQSTEVQKIEIRRGLDTAVKEAASGAQFGRDFMDHVHGRKDIDE